MANEGKPTETPGHGRPDGPGKPDRPPGKPGDLPDPHTDVPGPHDPPRPPDRREVG